MRRAEARNMRFGGTVLAPDLGRGHAFIRRDVPRRKDRK